MRLVIIMHLVCVFLIGASFGVAVVDVMAGAVSLAITLGVCIACTFIRDERDYATGRRYLGKL